MKAADVATSAGIGENVLDVVEDCRACEIELLQLALEDTHVFEKLGVAGGIHLPVHQGLAEVSRPHVDGLENGVLGHDTFGHG